MSEQNLGIEVPGESKPLEVVETLAKEVFGWQTKDEFVAAGHDPEKHTSAEEYIRKEKQIRESMKQSYDRVVDEKKQLSRTLDNLKNHYMGLRSAIETEYKDEIATLRAAKRNLIKEGETERAMLLDDQIDTIQEKHQEKLEALNQQEQQQMQSAGPDPQIQQELTAELNAWREKNSWYTGNPSHVNTKTADAYAQKWVIDNGGPQAMVQPGGMKRMLRYVEDQMKELKPDLFENPTRKRESRVDEGGTQQGNSTGNIRFTAEQEKVFQSYLAMDVKGEDGKPITRQQLAAEWKKMGVL